MIGNETNKEKCYDLKKSSIELPSIFLHKKTAKINFGSMVKIEQKYIFQSFFSLFSIIFIVFLLKYSAAESRVVCKLALCISIKSRQGSTMSLLELH